MKQSATLARLSKKTVAFMLDELENNGAFY